MPATQQRPQQQKQQGNGEQESPLLDKVIEQSVLDRPFTYTPLAEQQEITLTIRKVRDYLCVPTKSGKMPTEQDCTKYVMMCRQRGLNPWVGDCYLLGYDSEQGPKFSMVVAIQALLKRAELARGAAGQGAFDGMESGVVIQREAEIIERPGDLVMEGEKLLGGWAKVYRNDRKIPFYQRLKLQTYQKGTPIWRQDGAGMIAKCASSAALREAFPSDIGGLYVAEEIEAFADSNRRQTPTQSTVNLQQFIDSSLEKQAPGGTIEPAPAAVPDETSQVSDQTQEVIDEPPTAQTAPFDDEAELNNWQVDIDEAGLERLDALEQEANDIPLDDFKKRVLANINTRREALQTKTKKQK